MASFPSINEIDKQEEEGEKEETEKRKEEEECIRNSFIWYLSCGIDIFRLKKNQSSRLNCLCVLVKQR